MSRLAPFFSSTRNYIVVGASTNPTKFGYKVLNWYLGHNLQVIPVNPTSESILGKKTAPSIFDAIDLLKQQHLDSNGSGENENGGFDGVSVSFITPPSVTESIIDQLISKGYGNNGSDGSGLLKGFWFQPGSFTSDAVKKSKEKLNVGTVIDDDCILVSGEQGLTQAKL